MKYEILLFDLDNTLLDFNANEREALTTVFTNHGIVMTPDVYEIYDEVNSTLWHRHENGEIFLDEVVNTRFPKTLAALGIAIDGTQWESEYREYLGHGFQTMPNALEICNKLREQYRLFAATNGLEKTQIRRLHNSGLYPVFEDIFISQSIGHQKPTSEFFDYVKSHIPNYRDDKALMIGDTLNTDIRGGLQAGIDTCWISFGTQCPANAPQSTYTINTLDELLPLLTEMATSAVV